MQKKSLELSKLRVIYLFLRIQSEANLLSTDKTSISVTIHDPETILNVMSAHFEHIHAYLESSPDNFFVSFSNIKADFECSKSTEMSFKAHRKANQLTEEQTMYYFITDNILNIIQKNIPEEQTILFKNLLNNGHFPKIWKLAKVLLGKKDKDHIHLNNTQAISLLANISKVFEIYINILKTKFCKKLHISTEKQFGFKFRH